MADKSQRTEKPTGKRKREMREKGNVARSTELGGWASFLLICSFLPQLGGSAAGRVFGFVDNTVQAMSHPDAGTAAALVGQGLSAAAFASLPILLTAGAVGLAASLAQVGIRFTPKAMSLKFSRISPKSGMKKVFSSQGFWSLGKTLLKVAVLASMGYAIMHQLINSVVGGATLPLGTTVASSLETLVKLVRFVGVLAFILALADYMFQRHSNMQEMRMTKQEIKDEQRETDGAPETRRAVRTRARKISRMSMMAAVASADVVVTNPTHFAVAIAYDRNRDFAPRVVAKGADFNALAIKERARSCGVVIVENPPLARMMHSSCEVDDLVPPELYAAVAQLLAFVYSLSPTSRAFQDVHRMSG